LDATAIRVGEQSDTDAEIKRLAKLSVVEYERERKGAAERLGVRTSILDRLVTAERDKAGNGKQGRALKLPEPEPWHEPVGGAELLTKRIVSDHSQVHRHDRLHGRHRRALGAAHVFARLLRHLAEARDHFAGEAMRQDHHA